MGTEGDARSRASRGGGPEARACFYLLRILIDVTRRKNRTKCGVGCPTGSDEGAGISGGISVGLMTVSRIRVIESGRRRRDVESAAQRVRARVIYILYCRTCVGPAFQRIDSALGPSDSVVACGDIRGPALLRQPLHIAQCCTTISTLCIKSSGRLFSRRRRRRRARLCAHRAARVERPTMPARTRSARPIPLP